MVRPSKTMGWNRQSGLRGRRTHHGASLQAGEAVNKAEGANNEADDADNETVKADNIEKRDGKIQN